MGASKLTFIYFWKELRVKNLVHLQGQLLINHGPLNTDYANSSFIVVTIWIENIKQKMVSKEEENYNAYHNKFSAPKVYQRKKKLPYLQYLDMLRVRAYQEKLEMWQFFVLWYHFPFSSFDIIFLLAVKRAVGLRKNTCSNGNTISKS